MDGDKISVLGHGYVMPVESWGSDEAIIQAARMSTAKGFQGWPGDEKLLRYLWEHKHATPFEMSGMIIEVQAPIFVFREWHRHRTQSYNEMSARYTPLPDVNYIPTADRCMVVNGVNKQANGVGAILGHSAALRWLERLAEYYAFGQQLYADGIDLGVPKEIARLAVPVGRYSRMRASANLRNWFAFLTLRSDYTSDGKAAQWEIRQFANVVGKLIEERFPRSFKVFSEVGHG